MADPTPLRKFRADNELWEKFNNAVQRSPDAEADMSKVLRQFVRWYAGEPGAKLPERPEVKEED
jgi:hypothetical protein